MADINYWHVDSFTFQFKTAKIYLCPEFQISYCRIYASYINKYIWLFDYSYINVYHSCYLSLFLYLFLYSTFKIYDFRLYFLLLSFRKWSSIIFWIATYWWYTIVLFVMLLIITLLPQISLAAAWVFHLLYRVIH